MAHISQEGRAITFFDPEKAMWNRVGSILKIAEWFWTVLGTPFCILECKAGEEDYHNLEEPPYIFASDILARKWAARDSKRHIGQGHCLETSSPGSHVKESSMGLLKYRAE